MRGARPLRSSRHPVASVHHTGVGWWQPPKGRAAGLHAPPRHRAVEFTEVLPIVLAPGRPRRTVGDVLSRTCSRLLSRLLNRVLARRLRRPGRSRHPRLLAAAGQRARRRPLVRAAIGVASTAVLTPVFAFTIGYLAFAVPTADDAVRNQVANHQVALVSFADGSTLVQLVPEEGNRVTVPLEQVPTHVRNAVLAAEDAGFYSNPRSTITQQLLETALGRDEQSLWRTFREFVLEVKIAQERGKDEILADYLNTAYFGRGAYGIQSAAQAYFAKDVQALTPTEGALLAGLIQSPSHGDPAVSPERAVERWEFVLDTMASQGWLASADRAAAQFPPTVVRKGLPGSVPPDNRGHIVSAVIAELEGLGITEQDIARDGLRITTTIDPDRQQQAVAAAQDALVGRPADLGSAMVAIDPETGGILAYYGGDNGLGQDYAQVRRLAGSTFEPFVVLAGLMQDPPVGPGEAKASPAEVAAAARAAGIMSPLDDANDGPNDGGALGDTQVSTLELASAYATIAAGGVWRQPHLVASVATADGRVLYQAATVGERRFPEHVARGVTESMLAVAELGGPPVAARTGTVRSQFEGESNDARMAGFTPSLSSAVWTGSVVDSDVSSPIQTPRSNPIQDVISLPGKVWQQFMSTVTNHKTTHHDPPNRRTTDDEPAEDAAPTTPEQTPRERSGLRRLFGEPDEVEPTEQDCLLLPCGSS